ncbi:MAG: glycosyltransferase family 9 protein [Planctomycetaceae bacterium]|nr:glycosyltransferase family 9 protein [Planctomycetaceae bacterium]
MTDHGAGEGGTVIVLRPGALGDVLVTRAALRYLRAVVPYAEVVLVAPGEQGRFLTRPGWADRSVDWDAAWLSWLFSASPDCPPERLTELFRTARLVIAFTQTGEDAADDRFVRQVGRLTAAPVFLAPSRPFTNGRDVYVGQERRIDAWLLEHVAVAVTGMSGFVPLAEPENGPVRKCSLLARVPVAEPSPEMVPFVPGKRYLAIHPGSGSRRKNWALERFAAVAAALRPEVVDGVVVTAGEADGDAGSRLAGLIPGSVLAEKRGLADIARILAHAAVYVGNDSGVSHLAAAVRPEATDGGPAMVVLFGPSDPAIWCPRGAVPVHCGADMKDIPVDAVVAAVKKAVPGGGSAKSGTELS